MSDSKNLDTVYIKCDYFGRKIKVGDIVYSTENYLCCSESCFVSAVADVLELTL